jgi:hypothetical protein
MWKTQKKVIFILILKHQYTQTKSRHKPAFFKILYGYPEH